MKHWRLKHRDIQNIFNHHQHVRSGPLKCLAQPSTNGLKMAIAVAKTIKPQVKKNLVKRQLRALVLQQKAQWNEWRLVVVVNPKYWQHNYAEIQEHLQRNLKQLKLSNNRFAHHT